MARDYGKKGRKSGGSRSRGGGRKPAPGWLWLVVGLTVGLFIAFLVFLSQHEDPPARAETPVKEKKKPAPEPKKAVAKAAPAANTAVAKKPEVQAPEKKPLSYDFYRKLENFEVEVPEDKGTGRPKPVAAPGSYVLQAGSFKTARDAESRKAELALLGIRSSVQSVQVEANVTYHRVRIGPYRDLDHINKVRQTLRDNHIDFVTLKERS